MITKHNYDLMAEIRFLNKSDQSESLYYSISYGKVAISIRVSDHYFNKWKGDFQILVPHPYDLSRNDIKDRAFEAMVRKYTRELSKSKKKT